MIESLSIAKACIKRENSTLYNINITIKSAKRSKTKQIKIIKYYNYNKIKHISWYCLEPKKDYKIKKNNETNNKKIKNRIKAKTKDIIKKSIKFDD